nr:hypothetical protein [Tanacetum cinerariifolium]
MTKWLSSSTCSEFLIRLRGEKGSSINRRRVESTRDCKNESRVADSVALFLHAPFTLLASYSLLPCFIINISIIILRFHSNLKPPPESPLHRVQNPPGVLGPSPPASGKHSHLVTIAAIERQPAAETKWKGSSNREANGYKLWYSGSPTATNGVGIILNECLKDKVVHINRCSDGIISLMLVINGRPLIQGREGVPDKPTTDPRRRFEWAYRSNDGGNAGVYGGFGYGTRNEEGRAILDFSTACDLGIVNSHFKKRDHHLITFQSGGRCTQIDYLLVRRGDLKACKDYRVFPIEAFSSQHSLLTLDILFKNVQCRREECLVKALAACDADSMWSTLASIIKDAAKDTLGVAIGTSNTHTTRKESWWLCEEVQSIVAVKQVRFQELLSCQKGNEEERLGTLERYKEAKRQAKKAVALAKEKTDSGDICFVTYEEGRNITDEAEIKKRREEYFSSLFARELEGHKEGVGLNREPHIECYYSRISMAEVRTASQKMGRNKVVGPDQIPIEAWKSLGDEVCCNYKGIKLLGHTMKLWERVIERRLRRETLVYENQFGFMPERSSVEAIHLIRSLIEKYTERQRDLHMAFLDLEKAYDSVPRELIWKTLVEKGTSRRYLG